MIRRLSFEEYRLIYKTRVIKDFPRMERRPLYIVKKMYAAGAYVCLAMEENSDIKAYACFIFDDSADGVFLDLYAVDENSRGGGIGSRFLTELKEHWPGKTGIILECELPSAAENNAERLVRERRIEFYLRLGARITGLDWRAFGVDYNVLWLPISGKGNDEIIADELVSLYSISLPRLVARSALKLR